MKIVVLDGYTENPGDLSWDEMKKYGELTVYDRTPAEEVVNRIGNAEVVFTNKTPITKETMDACPDFKFISVLATGYNVIDVNYAKEKGIVVSNIPTYGTDCVGQFAIALLLEICHRIGHHDKAVKEGRWENAPDWCFWDYPLIEPAGNDMYAQIKNFYVELAEKSNLNGIELAGKTLGIIGFGRIGQKTGTIAKAMGMNVLAYDSHLNDKGRDIAEYVELDEIFAKSDVISLHCPLFPSTEGIINKDNIARMKDGVIIINNSRGQLIVEKDLADALNSGKVYAAGLDVVSTEPVKGDNPLLKAKNCIITPHISWAPKEARQRIMDMSVENLKQFLAGNPVNVVNR